MTPKYVNFHLIRHNIYITYLIYMYSWYLLSNHMLSNLNSCIYEGSLFNFQFEVFTFFRNLGHSYITSFYWQKKTIRKYVSVYLNYCFICPGNKVFSYEIKWYTCISTVCWLVYLRGEEMGSKTNPLLLSNQISSYNAHSFVLKT